MFSKMTQVLVLAGCLITGGAASASERNVILPVIAGAAVGAVLATVISKSNHDNNQRRDYRGYPPQPRYQPRYQPVAYVPLRQVEYRRFAPAPPRGYYGGGYYRQDNRGYDRGRGDGRW